MGKERRESALFSAFDDWDPPEIAVPEKSLLRAILLNAIADLRRPGDFKRKATEFFLSREEDYIFSFQSICGYLNIDPSQVLVVVGLNGEETIETGDKLDS
jgi:hypothetical protein